MGMVQSIQKVNFEDIQNAAKSNIILINTLSSREQDCLIVNTIHCDREEEIVNKYLKSNPDICIYVYGKHNMDDTAYKKYEQLIQLGFTNAYLYIGGLFEWLLLQDIYGDEDFPTTKKELDILKFKPPSQTPQQLLTFSSHR